MFVFFYNSRDDLLMNAKAAVEGLGPLLDTDPERFLDMYKVNVLGPLMLTQALAGTLLRCGGCVVNIGSVGVSGLPFHGVYASSKVGHRSEALSIGSTTKKS